jgi:hypothetical protein
MAQTSRTETALEIVKKRADLADFSDKVKASLAMLAVFRCETMP